MTSPPPAAFDEHRGAEGLEQLERCLAPGAGPRGCCYPCVRCPCKTCKDCARIVRDKMTAEHPQKATMIPTEPIGSIARPLQLIDAAGALGDDHTSTSRDIAFQKIRARVLGTAPSGQAIEGR